MSTHITKCVVCRNKCYCCNDLHALGCGGEKGEGGCNNRPYIEFCSEECFHVLEKRMSEAWSRYKECAV